MSIYVYGCNVISRQRQSLKPFGFNMMGNKPCVAVFFQFNGKICQICFSKTVFSLFGRILDNALKGNRCRGRRSEIVEFHLHFVYANASDVEPVKSPFYAIKRCLGVGREIFLNFFDVPGHQGVLNGVDRSLKPLPDWFQPSRREQTRPR